MLLNQSQYSQQFRVAHKGFAFDVVNYIVDLFCFHAEFDFKGLQEILALLYALENALDQKIEAIVDFVQAVDADMAYEKFFKRLLFFPRNLPYYLASCVVAKLIEVKQSSVSFDDAALLRL